MPGNFIIPDLHGCINTLDYVLSSIIKPTKKDQIVFLGDFVNKGPDSKSVLDVVINLVQNNTRIKAVLGNHDQLMLHARNSEKDFRNFLEKGGEQTMKSFRVSHIKDIPNKYFSFLESLPFFIENEKILLVHAGFNFDIDDPFTDIESMINIRGFRYNTKKAGNRKIIHGHNASSLETIIGNLNSKESMVFNIDNGCVYSEKEHMGNLFVLNLADFSYHIQPNLDV